jgi:hypothetical protein
VPELPPEPSAEPPTPKPYVVLGHPVSTLSLREMPEAELIALPSLVLYELGKPRRIPGSSPPRYERREDADEMLDRLWGRTPERRRERQQAKRAEERQEHEEQAKIDRRRKVIGGQREGFAGRWKDFLAYVMRRWGQPAMNRAFWNRRTLMPKITTADARGTDEIWDEAVTVLVQRGDISEPFSYFCAVLERMVDASIRELPPGGAVVAPRVLGARGSVVAPEDLLDRWLDQPGGNK